MQTKFASFKEEEIDNSEFIKLVNYISYKNNITKEAVGDAIGMKKSMMSIYTKNSRPVPEGKIESLVDAFGITNLELFNNVLDKTSPPNITKSPNGRLPKKIGTGLVKFYDVDFAAGDIEFYEDANAITPAYEMDIPEFSGCTAFRTYGDSMEPMIKSGSILFGTKIEDWQSHLEYGQIYGIVCTDKRKYLKYIRKDKTNPEKQFLLRSENEEYDDFELPKNKIKHIWLIHGWINKRN